LVILARINYQIASSFGDLKRYFKKDDFMAISKYLDERLIVFLEEHSRDAAIERLVDVLDKTGKLRDKNAFHTAILDREKIVSTGIGIGVAIPHAKLEGYSDFFIAIGIQKKKGIDWNALDGSEVKLIFMIGGPENRQTEYLKILSRLTQAIKDEERRKKILKTNSPGEVIDLFRGC
jgi:PTS system nitrogen regulatory IIA component